MEKIGFRYESDEYYRCFDDRYGPNENYKKAAYIIIQVTQAPDTDETTKESVMKQLY